MNFAEYPALAARTEKPLPTVFARMEHAALGVATETGEIATIIKRICIYGKTLDSVVEKGPDAGKTFRQLIAEESGDVLWYLPIITREFDPEGETFGRVPAAPAAEITRRDTLNMALASVSRRLTIAAGRIAQRIEDEFGLEPSVVDLIHEVRAILAALVDLAYLIGVDLIDVARDNIAKLRERFPDAYSDEAAEARLDKGGEDARNS
jgi:NTP pyrophosphatase (non-canonical NTP hydrolase)